MTTDVDYTKDLCDQCGLELIMPEDPQHRPNHQCLYKEVNGTSYHSDTPDDLIKILEEYRLSKERVIFIYGDVKTGIPWPAFGPPDRGSISRSMGKNKIPILVRTARSLGGVAILDHCILEIRKSRGGEVIYRRKI
jgi:hypothetical protein